MSEGPLPATGLAVRGLRKSYGGRAVLDGLDLDVAPGEVVALVGPNGAGKTTLLRCVVGADAPERGRVVLDGADLDERRPAVRRAVAAVLDDLDFFPDLTVAEHLDLLGRAHGTPEPERATDDALTELGLVEVADQLPGTLSSGQRRRLALATTVVRPARLLVLDEPEQRLDVAGRAWLGEHLRARAAAGTAVLLASHDEELLARAGARRVDLSAA